MCLKYSICSRKTNRTKISITQQVNKIKDARIVNLASFIKKEIKWIFG